MFEFVLIFKSIFYYSLCYLTAILILIQPYYLYIRNYRALLITSIISSIFQSFWLLYVFFPYGILGFISYITLYFFFTLGLIKLFVLVKNKIFSSIIYFIWLWLFHTFFLFIFPFPFAHVSAYLVDFSTFDKVLYLSNSTVFSVLLLFTIYILFHVRQKSIVIIILICFLSIKKEKQIVETDLNILISNTRFNRYQSNESFHYLLQRLENLDSIDLAIFPETILKKNLAEDFSNDSRIKRILRKLNNNQYVIFGARRDFSGYNNLLCILNSKGNLDTYEKRHYIPICEYDLYGVERVIKYYKSLWNMKSEPFEIKKQKFNVFLCFDACFPIWKKENVDFYIQITEELFFTNSYPQFLYEKQTMLRSIESQKPIIRCSNGGQGGLYFPNRTKNNLTTFKLLTY